MGFPFEWDKLGNQSRSEWYSAEPLTRWFHKMTLGRKHVYLVSKALLIPIHAEKAFVSKADF